jgi:hypothetical protein
MDTCPKVRPVEPSSAGKLSPDSLPHLLAGLHRQREELGPIADELLELLHGMGAEEAPDGVIRQRNG